MSKNYITVSNYVEVEFDVRVPEIIDQIDSNDLINELRKRGDFNIEVIPSTPGNGHTRELYETISKIINQHSNHLELNRELELKYLQ